MSRRGVLQGVMFDSVNQVSSKLQSIGYIADSVTRQLIYLAARMNKPLLVEGPAGSDKTELAYAIAKATQKPVNRLVNEFVKPFVDGEFALLERLK